MSKRQHSWREQSKKRGNRKWGLLFVKYIGIVGYPLVVVRVRVTNFDFHRPAVRFWQTSFSRLLKPLFPATLGGGVFNLQQSAALGKRSGNKNIS